MLVVFAIIVVLIGLTLPAVQKFRATADNLVTVDHMRQIGLATVNYAQKSRSKKLPSALEFSGFTDANGRQVHHTMFVTLLPFLQQTNIYNEATTQANYNPVLSSTTWARRVVPVYLSPEDSSTVEGISNRGLAVVNFGANAQLFMDFSLAPNFDQDVMVKGARKLSEIRDGQSNTIMLSTRYGNCGNGGSMWAAPEVRAVYYDLAQNMTSAVTYGPFFGHIYPPQPPGLTFQLAPEVGNCNPDLPQAFLRSAIVVCMADASVKRVSKNVDASLWENVLLPANGKPTNLDW